MDAKTPDTSETLSRSSRRNPLHRIGRQARLLTFLAVGIAGGAVLADWIYDRFTHVYIDDARISADVISISSRVSGWVTKLHVATGDRIKAGDTLVRIDERDARLRLTELDARLLSIDAERARLSAQKQMIDQQTRSQYAMRQSQVEAAEAALAGRRSDLDLARTDFDRTRTLLQKKVVSRQRWEEKRTVFRVAEQAFQQARAEVAAANAGLIEAAANRQQLLVLDRQVTALSHQKQELRAQRDRQELDLRDRRILSPIDGVVDKTFVNASEFVSAGQRLLMVHDPRQIWVDANVKETDIRHLKLGAPARISVDAYPDSVFTGKITRIGNAATSEFALLPTPNKTSDVLRPGMMVEVNIGIDDR